MSRTGKDDGGGGSSFTPCQEQLLVTLSALPDTAGNKKLGKSGCNIVELNDDTSGWNFKYLTSNSTALASDWLWLDTSGGAFEVTLPATPSAGEQVFMQYVNDNSDENPVIVRRNGENIWSQADDLTLDLTDLSGAERVWVWFTYVNATIGWVYNYDYEDVTTGGGFKSTAFTQGFNIS